MPSSDLIGWLAAHRRLTPAVEPHDGYRPPKATAQLVAVKGHCRPAHLVYLAWPRFIGPR
jgi:hypothetical protein